MGTVEAGFPHERAMPCRRNDRYYRREVEADGIINRKVFPEVPPRVQYALTEKGLTLRPIILAMREWGLKFAVPNACP